MNRFSVVAAAAILVSASSALAADMSGKSETASPSALPFSWTGAYGGISFGLSMAQQNVNPALFETGFGYTPAILETYTPNAFATNRVGFLGGALAGFNYQINRIVVGAEADFMGAALSGQGSAVRYVATDPVTGQPSSTQISNRLQQNWLGTVRARVGYAEDRILLYATAGFAYGAVKSSSQILLTDYLPNTQNEFNWAGQQSQIKTGYALGAGVEYALSDQWTLRGEYLYYNLGKISSGMTPTTAVVYGTSFANTEAFAGSTRTAVDGNVVRAVLSYKF